MRRALPEVVGPSDVNRKFAVVVKALSTQVGVTHGGAKRGFGATALKINGKIFAMVSSKAFFVVKLPNARVTELVDAGKGECFDPGRRKKMKEWFATREGTSASWTKLAKEAHQFVAGTGRAESR